MPDYEYFCRQCEKPFTAHMTVKEHDESRMPECPECKTDKQVERMISHFNVQTSRKSARY